MTPHPTGQEPRFTIYACEGCHSYALNVPHIVGDPCLCNTGHWREVECVPTDSIRPLMSALSRFVDSAAPFEDQWSAEFRDLNEQALEALAHWKERD